MTPENRPGPRWGLVVLLGTALVVLHCGWIAHSEMKTYVTEITISALLIGVAFLLFLLTLLNRLFSLWSPRAALTQAELMTLYAMLSLSGVIAGMGHFGLFLPYLAGASWDADKNGWRGFLGDLPPIIGPRDPAVLQGFYYGHAWPLSAAQWAAWLPPLLVWCGFFLTLLGTTLCLAAVLERRWREEEHMPFPILSLPLEMTRPDAPLYSRPLFWMGFGIPLALHSLNSLHSLYPGLPSLPVNSIHDLSNDGVLQYPWNGLDSMPYLLHPAGIGFGYLTNTDVSFSLWFFFLLKRFVKVGAVAVGWRDPAQGWRGDAAAQFPYTGYQAWGAWFGLGILTLWSARHYLKGFWERAARGEASAPPSLLGERAALLGLGIGFAFLVAFLRCLGASWGMAGLFVVCYLLLMLALARVRAETCVVATELEWVTPQAMLSTLAGTSQLSRGDLLALGQCFWFNSDYRTPPLAHQLEGIVGLRRSGVSPRPLLGVLMFTALVSMVAALAWDLQMYYSEGASAGVLNLWRPWKAAEGWRNIHEWTANPKPPNLAAGVSALVGFVITAFLTALRGRFVGFPLHPTAYVINTSMANDQFWCDMLVAWAVKSLILRYGGMQRFRHALPFFLGLILGDFATGAAWSLFGAVCGFDLFRTFAV